MFYEILIKNNPDKKIQILTHHEFGRHSHASYLLNKGLGYHFCLIDKPKYFWIYLIIILVIMIIIKVILYI